MYINKKQIKPNFTLRDSNTQRLLPSSSTLFHHRSPTSNLPVIKINIYIYLICILTHFCLYMHINRLFMTNLDISEFFLPVIFLTVQKSADRSSTIMIKLVMKLSLNHPHSRYVTIARHRKSR